MTDVDELLYDYLIRHKLSEIKNSIAVVNDRINDLDAPTMMSVLDEVIKSVKQQESRVLMMIDEKTRVSLRDTKLTDLKIYYDGEWWSIGGRLRDGCNWQKEFEATWHDGEVRLRLFHDNTNWVLGMGGIDVSCEDDLQKVVSDYEVDNMHLSSSDFATELNGKMAQVFKVLSSCGMWSRNTYFTQMFTQFAQFAQ